MTNRMSVSEARVGERLRSRFGETVSYSRAGLGAVDWLVTIGATTTTTIDSNNQTVRVDFREFVGDPSELVIDDTVITPEAGDEIIWVNPLGKTVTHIVSQIGGDAKPYRRSGHHGRDIRVHTTIGKVV